MKLRDGMRVKCKICGVEINDAKLTFEDGKWYICQDVKNGSSCRDKKGYRYSWYFQQYPNGTYSDGVTDLRPFSPDIEDVYKGAIIESPAGKRKVLGICGEVVFLSRLDFVPEDFEKYGGAVTISELKEQAYKLVLPEEPKSEEMIDIDGKQYSKATIKEALKKYCE